MMFQREKRKRLKALCDKKGYVDLNDLFNCEVTGEELDHYLVSGLLTKKGEGQYTYDGPKVGGLKSKSSDFSKKLYERAVQRDYDNLYNLLGGEKYSSSLEDALKKILRTLKGLREGDPIPIVRNKYSTSFVQAINKGDFYQAFVLLKAKEQQQELSYFEKAILILLQEVNEEIARREICYSKKVEEALLNEEDEAYKISKDTLSLVITHITMMGVTVNEACINLNLTNGQISLVKLVLAKEFMRIGRFAVADMLVQEVKDQNSDSRVIHCFLSDIETNLQNMQMHPKTNLNTMEVSLRRLPKTCVVGKKLQESKESY